MDGVLFDHVGPLVRLLRERFDVRLDPGLLREWDFAREPAVLARGIPRAAVYGLLRDIEADDGLHADGLRDPAAPAILRDWAEAGHEVHVVTARGHHATQSTRRFLRHHGIVHHGLHMAMKSKAGWDVLVDDAPHNVAAAAAEDGVALLMDQPYNRHVAATANPLRVMHWAEVGERVLAVSADPARVWRQGAVQQRLPSLPPPGAPL